MLERRPDVSRHRSPSRFAPSPRVRRVLTVAGPSLSLLTPVLLVVLLQASSPAAQRVPVGTGRYDLAAAWLSGRPGALAGLDLRSAAPVLGRVQLGLLLDVLGAGGGRTVLAAAHAAMLLLAAAQTALLWWALRRTGARRLAAGLAATVFGVAPVAILTHGTVSATAVGVCWALLAAALLAGPASASRSVVGGVAAALAVGSTPALLPLLVVPAVVLVLRSRATGRPEPLLAAGTGLVAGVVVFVGLAVVAGAGTRNAAGRSLAAIGGAQDLRPSVGAAALAAWWGADPVLAVTAVVGLVAVVAVGRDLWRALALGVALLNAVWPLGDDPVTPLVLLLPLLAVVVAAAVDLGVRALADPRFAWSVAGSGWLTGVGAVIVVGVVAWLAGLGGLVRGPDQPIARVERWLATGVPAGQRVLVGLGAWPDLESDSRAQVGWYAGGASALPSSMPWSSADYVVADASLPPRRTGAAAAVLGRSLEVARYGSGADAMDIRAIRVRATPTPSVTPPTTAADRAALASRRQAGRQLAENPRLRIDGDGRAALLAGAVDQRVAVVLAQFMTTHRVTVTSFGDADSAGVRHGATIREVDGQRVPAEPAATGALLRFLSALGGDVAPTSIDAGTAGVTATFG